MSTPDQPSTPTTGSARRLLLGHHQPAADGEPDPAVHLIPLLLTGQEYQPGVNACCGVRLLADEIEPGAPGEGAWCTMCFVAHVTGHTPPPSLSTGSSDAAAAQCRAAALAYRTLGWPVVLRRDEIALNLDRDLDAVALLIPALLATEVTDILTRRHCPSPVLAHPALPSHRIFLAGERFGVPLKNWRRGRRTSLTRLWQVRKLLPRI